MSKKITIEFKDPVLYKDLLQIARLVKETPEELLQRAFREWIELREDMEDLEIARERIAEYERTGDSVPLEEVMRDLGLTPEHSPSP